MIEYFWDLIFCKKVFEKTMIIFKLKNKFSKVAQY